MKSESGLIRVRHPVLDSRVRRLCRKPYPGHPHGCQNWDKKDGCPPGAPLIKTLLDASQPLWCVYNRFDLGAHVDRMRAKHPDWSWRQLVCCLYWQGTARKQLKAKVEAALVQQPGLHVLYIPEACGVNITATMERLGVKLEWPPKKWAHQVALLGTLRSR
jgi:predicted metal-binding protein